jgi:hypothetical protein
MKPDWLAQLAPAHAPPPPGLWPLAPGWWGIAILLVIGIAVLAYWQSRPVVRIRHAALRELNRLEKAAIDDSDLARRLESLLRRFAVSRFGRAEVAKLTGENWIAFVAQHGGAELGGDTGAGLLRAAWGGTANVDRERWIKGARAFMKEQR